MPRYIHQEKSKITYSLFWVAVTLVYAVTFIVPEAFQGEFSTLSSLLRILAKCIFLTGVTAGLVCVISINRIIFALLFPALIILSSAVLYFITSIGSGISPGVVDLAMANGLSMWLTLFSAKLVIVLLIALAASVAVVIIRWKYVRVGSVRVLDYTMLGLVLMLIPYNWSPRFHDAIAMRLPFSLYYSVAGYMDNWQAVLEVRTTYDNTEAYKNENAPDVYIILGESLRADHLPFNGYDRNTMPLMSRDTALVSFSNIYSEKWFTHASVPVIMTDTDSLTRDRAYTEQSFITLFNKAGYKSLWLANQDLSRSYAPFAAEADTLIFCNNVLSVYSYAKYLDTDILPYFDNWVQSTDADSPRLVIIHTIGSHWWYKSHYPDVVGNFKPEVDSHDVGSLSQEQLVNSYDNTILETDRFLSGLIGRIRNKNSIIIFISDHGENLGEEGEYMHQNPIIHTLHPACMIWYSETYAKTFPDKILSIMNNRNVHAKTDAIFHTVLDVADISTPVLNKQRSLLYDSEKD